MLRSDSNAPYLVLFLRLDGKYRMFGRLKKFLKGDYAVPADEAQAAKDELHIELMALPKVGKDFSSPEGAILCLEDAYRKRDIEAAVAAKDFATEARRMLQKSQTDNRVSLYDDGIKVVRHSQKRSKPFLSRWLRLTPREPKMCCTQRALQIGIRIPSTTQTSSRSWADNPPSR